MKSAWAVLLKPTAAVAAIVTLMVASAMAVAAPINAADEFPEEAAALISATSTLFDDIEAGFAESKPKNALPVIRMKVLATPASMTSNGVLEQAFPRNRGPVTNLTGYRITWYPVDRFLGAVDFMGTYDGNRNLVCGFVTWDLTDVTEPKLEHLVANYVDLNLLSELPPADAHEALLNANCAYGQIDPNFSVFNPAS
ncbi:MAG: hypothetical protein OXQ30_01380 [Boseongicola sp.]|nr:hypothetical protein [Boseongicola sp.]